MLRDSQLWNKIGRICYLLAKELKVTPERAFDIFMMSMTNKLLHDERSLLYTMGDLYIVDEVIIEMRSPDKVRRLELFYQREEEERKKKEQEAGAEV